MKRFEIAFVPRMLVCTPAALADTANCLAQPSRTCVFQMVTRQALAAPTPIRTASGFLMVAALQEIEGLPAYRQIPDQSVTAMHAINPDPAEMKNAVAGAIWSISIASADLFSETPGQPKFIFATSETYALGDRPIY